MKKKSGEKQVLRKLLPIVIGAVFDVLHYYYHRYISTAVDFYSMGDCIGLGLLISLFLIIWEARKGRIDAVREIERSNILEKMAYTDALTGIDNRAAFTKAVEEITSEVSSRKNLLIVSADLNGLKHTNDTKGHIAGDQLIQKAAAVLSESLCPYGRVFRTGGDEFFALLDNVDESLWKHLKLDLNRRIKAANEQEGLHLSIAMGAASLENGNINEAIELSDQRMYADKEEQHQKLKI